MDVLLALDQGTTSTRVLLFDTNGQVLDMQSSPVAQSFPNVGWVEQSPEEIWLSSTKVVHQVMARAQGKYDIQAMGIANQRETTVVWDKQSGEAIYPAISWQDRRTFKTCEALQEQGVEDLIKKKTGLVIDPYFSALKIAWILDHVKDARAKALKGNLLFGTIDTYLLWHFTKGKIHATDSTNASRTMLLNLETLDWDDELCELFNIPRQMLPQVQASASYFGRLDPQTFDLSIPITGMVGDQQGASIGQACIHPGDFKSTYGTGCFMLMNTGTTIKYSQNRLLTTVAYQCQGKVSYALEGSIFMAGSIMQWLRDGLQLLSDVSLSEQFAAEIKDDSSVMFLPAMTGLGAPFWDANAKGAILGLSQGDGPKAIIRAALESVCFQTKILMDTFTMDVGHPAYRFKVDGGMSANDWMLQTLSETLGMAVQRPQSIETTAFGAAFLAGLGAEVYHSLEHVQACWQSQIEFQPTQKQVLFTTKYHRWLAALATLSPKVSTWLNQPNLKRKVND